MSKSKKKKSGSHSRIIAQNRRARHDYQIEDDFEAGIVLEGWEVKALREGRASVAESYVRIEKGEAWLIGAQIQALQSASTHVVPEPNRTRKLLLHAREIRRLIGATERKGYTLVPLDLHWSHGRAKLQFGIGLGKKAHDKRDAIKQRDWNRDKARLLRH
jgi:SsrA-binding protein